MVRRHVDQIRSVGDQVKDVYSSPYVYHQVPTELAPNKNSGAQNVEVSVPDVLNEKATIEVSAETVSRVLSPVPESSSSSPVKPDGSTAKGSTLSITAKP